MTEEFAGQKKLRKKDRIQREWSKAAKLDKEVKLVTMSTEEKYLELMQYEERPDGKDQMKYQSGYSKCSTRLRWHNQEC